MRNEYKITKQEMMSWAKEWHLQGVTNIVLFIIWCLSGIIGFGALVKMVFFGGHWIICFVFLLSWLVFLLFSPCFVLPKKYQVSTDAYGVTEWIRSTEFTDDEIIISDHTRFVKLKYEDIKRVVEKNNIVILFFKKNLAFRFYKDTFVEGSWEACKSKIDAMRN